MHECIKEKIEEIRRELHTYYDILGKVLDYEDFSVEMNEIELVYLKVKEACIYLHKFSNDVLCRGKMTNQEKNG